MSREAFGPTLRRSRLKAGISLERISAESKIPVELLAALERNDVSSWPVGIYARAYVRQYACAIGLDAEETVDEFCRCFPQGDRRVWRTVFQHSTIVGHETTWSDELPPDVSGLDRRGAAGRVSPELRSSPSALEVMVTRVRRALGRA
jgi:hypothetical protein